MKLPQSILIAHFTLSYTSSAILIEDLKDANVANLSSNMDIIIAGRDVSEVDFDKELNTIDMSNHSRHLDMVATYDHNRTYDSFSMINR